jgi:ATP-dependent DNA helicase DinG
MYGINESFEAAGGEALVACLPDLVERVFKRDGALQAVLGLDHRPEQARMAQRTIAAWMEDQALFFEAGTGVGKSLGYLVPGLMRAIASNRALVVSTHTIALQEQIENKDLAICRRLFSTVPALRGFADFRHALLLGKNNYLCGTRLRQALEARQELFPSGEQKELERIAAWAAQTQSGLRHELSPEPLPEVWEWIQADGHACNSRNCNPRTCFFRKAREAIREANLIIVNHSLFFSLLAAGHFPGQQSAGILFSKDFVVLDEAHCIPAVATEHFGLRLSGLGLKRQLMKLYQAGRRKHRGLLTRVGDPGLRNAVLALTEATDIVFGAIKDTFLAENSLFRLQAPDWFDNALDLPLRDLIHGLSKCESRIPEGPQRDELEGLRLSLQAYREGLNEMAQLADPKGVYWLESAGVKGTLVHLRSAPLDVAPVLRERLFKRETGILLTSATLAEGPDMDSFARKVGAPEVDREQVLSPFDYPLQMEILVHAKAPDIRDGQLDIAFLSNEILRHSVAWEGGTLVLFTSYRDLNEVRRRIENACRDAARPLLWQQSGVSRSALVQRFAKVGNGILLGTDSFWTGVDVPGKALSQLIITRLPFDNPSHPVAAARAEDCRERGVSSFNEITLPAALIKFRQGIGRLIRSHEDEGRLVILDSRILHKSYGHLFLDVLPHGQFKRFS